MPAVRGVITKYIYHVYEGPEVERDGFLTLLMDDKVFQIPPHEPYEMTADSNGRLLDAPDFYLYILLQTFGFYGIVQVETKRERTGIVMDLDKAEEDARAALQKSRWTYVEAWVQHQLNERIAHGKSVMPPVGFVEEAIKELNIDLQARYHLQPIGWDWKPDTSRPVLGNDPKSLGFLGSLAPQGGGAEAMALREENQRLNARLDRLERLLAKVVGEDEPGAEVQGDSTSQSEEPETVTVGTVQPRGGKKK